MSSRHIKGNSKQTKELLLFAGLAIFSTSVILITIHLYEKGRSAHSDNPSATSLTSKVQTVFTRLVSSVRKLTTKATPIPTPVPTVVPGLLTTNSTNTKVSEKDFQFIVEPTIRKQIATQVAVDAYRTTMEEADIKVKIVSQFQRTSQGIRKAVTTYQNDMEQSAFMSIDGMTYVKDEADGKWWKQATPSAPEWKANDINNFSNLSLKNPNIKYIFVKEEACGEQTCLRYKEDDANTKSSRRSFLFNKDTLLLYEESTGVASFLTVTRYEYPKITITPPSKTKDVPQNKSVFDYYKPITRYSFVQK